VKDSPFFAQADLMVRALPAVAGETCFALKGGTAINLFVRDLPRLSVDIDLTYVPVEPRAESLRKIGEALLRISQSLRRSIARVQVTEGAGEGGQTVKLLVREAGAQIKIEPNPSTCGEPCSASKSGQSARRKEPVLLRRRRAGVALDLPR
jgi:hypothetical protein